MAEFKIVLSTKDGKSYQREVKDNEAKPFLGKRIGDKVKGDLFGLAGYEVEVTGGSDKSGFPMRKDVDGTTRKRILAVEGTGMKKKRDGQRQRKTVCGNTVHGAIVQINLKVIKEGKEKLGAEEAPAEEAKPEAPKAEEKAKPEDKPKEAPKAEEKAKPEDKPKEAPKAEAPKEAKQEDKPAPAKEEKAEPAAPAGKPEDKPKKE